MSQQIDTAFVKQYHDVIERLLQQMGSRLRGKVRSETQQGEEAFWEQIGVVEAEEALTRHADSPIANTPHARRRVTLRQYDVGDMIDRFDRVKLLIDPSSTYVQNFVSALNRRVDWNLIGRVSPTDDLTVDGGFFGTAFTGKNGTTSVPFPGANEIAVDFGSTGTNSNMTINKWIEAKRLLLSFFNEPEMEEWYIGLTSSQLASLLKTTQVTSSDYNTVKALVRGEINSFLGFMVCLSEYWLKASANVRMVPAWTRNGMLQAYGMDINTRVAERPDKRFSWYAYAALSVGSTRMQENKVVKILCDETK